MILQFLMIELLKKHLFDPQLINRLRALAGDTGISTDSTLSNWERLWRHDDDWLNLYLTKNAPVLVQHAQPRGYSVSVSDIRQRK